MKNFLYSRFSYALLGSALLCFTSRIFAQNAPLQAPDLPPVTVEGQSKSSPYADLYLFKNDVLNVSPKNLAEALDHQLGLASSSFGQGANRPILRGMSASRTPILQNGLASGDASTISEDHAVAVDILFNQDIEVLRGAQSLRYSSGANQGLINLIDNRIPTRLLVAPQISFVSQYNFNQQGLTNGVFAEDSIGHWTLHVDNTTRSFNDYKRPDNQLQANSSQKSNDFALGGSYFRESGFVGASFNQFQTQYGIPSEEGAKIDLLSQRFSLMAEESNPFSGISKLATKLSYTDYAHQELSTDNVAQLEFKNKSLDARVEVFHNPIMGWTGSFGIQGGNSSISAMDLTSQGAAAVVIPSTKSNNLAIFAVENRSWGTFDIQEGIRYEVVDRSPNTAIPYSGEPNFDVPIGSLAPQSLHPVNKKYTLFSISHQAAWNYRPDQAVSLRYTFSQRAPSVEELYSFGNHEATATFGVGNTNLKKESANHFELGWKKNKGFAQGKLNVYQSYMRDFIYTQYTGVTDLESDFPVREYLQANAILKGVESELTLNAREDGFSGRVFADYTEGVLNNGSYLPLQPATRVGGAVHYNRLGWKSSASLIHALGQYKTASSAFYQEPSTESYNKLDFRISKSQSFQNFLVTYFVQGNNLLNDTIRYSTTVDTLRQTAPQPGRTFIAGIKIDY